MYRMTSPYNFFRIKAGELTIVPCSFLQLSFGEQCRHGGSISGLFRRERRKFDDVGLVPELLVYAHPGASLCESECRPAVQKIVHYALPLAFKGPKDTTCTLLKFSRRTSTCRQDKPARTRYVQPFVGERSSKQDPKGAVTESFDKTATLLNS